MHAVAYTDKALLLGTHYLPFGFAFTFDMQVVHSAVYSAVLSLEASSELQWAFTMLSWMLCPIRTCRCPVGRVQSLRPFSTLFLFLFDVPDWCYACRMSRYWCKQVESSESLARFICKQRKAEKTKTDFEAKSYASERMGTGLRPVRCARALNPGAPTPRSAFRSSAYQCLDLSTVNDEAYYSAF